MRLKLLSRLCAVALCLPTVTSLATDSERALTVRTTQEDITNGVLSLQEIRLRGRTLFSTPFTSADGFGDGIVGNTAEDRRKVSQRGSLQGNGTFNRINGLDAQTCLECHSVLSRATVPMKFAVGGAGGINNTVLGAGGGSFVNANDDLNQINDPDGFGTTGAQNINGRTINPPFVFGSGGIELLGNEMTTDLQALAASIADTPNTSVTLQTKGISFGTLNTDASGAFNTSAVEGIDSDPTSSTFLVVQPFGRKGEHITTRSFDISAMQFHHGMQPVEIVGEGVDDDGDGIVNEVLAGELSALNIFSATMERPVQTKSHKDKVRTGERLFNNIGCTDCHVPELNTTSETLGLRFPEIAQDPSANVYININLTAAPARFKRNHQGGIKVRLFADLKVHDMGPDLAEFNGDARFTTARLWGVADTAPYLHDGRALTITEAILIHGGTNSEAKPAVDNFKALSDNQQHAILDFLGTLRTPRHVGKDLDALAERR